MTCPAIANRVYFMIIEIKKSPNNGAYIYLGADGRKQASAPNVTLKTFNILFLFNYSDSEDLATLSSYVPVFNQGNILPTLINQVLPKLAFL